MLGWSHAPTNIGSQWSNRMFVSLCLLPTFTLNTNKALSLSNSVIKSFLAQWPRNLLLFIYIAIPLQQARNCINCNNCSSPVKARFKGNSLQATQKRVQAPLQYQPRPCQQDLVHPPDRHQSLDRYHTQFNQTMPCCRWTIHLTESMLMIPPHKQRLNSYTYLPWDP